LFLNLRTTARTNEQGLTELAGQAKIRDQHRE
jgi:hypothetical protein